MNSTCQPTVVSTGDAPAAFYNDKAFACGFSYPDQIPSANFSACCSGKQHFYNGCFHWCETRQDNILFNQCLGQQFDFLNGLAYGSLCNSNDVENGVERVRVGWKVLGVVVLVGSVVVNGW